ncbi:hypothetical protein CE91St54_49440 [Hungatella hathewayi]|nr:hypothetical protein CE91St54_49440 [Hungatella hathewayi]
MAATRNCWSKKGGITGSIRGSLNWSEKYLKSVKKKGIISDVGSLEIRKAVSKEWTENRRSET